MSPTLSSLFESLWGVGIFSLRNTIFVFWGYMFFLVVLRAVQPLFAYLFVLPRFKSGKMSARQLRKYVFQWRGIEDWGVDFQRWRRGNKQLHFASDEDMYVTTFYLEIVRSFSFPQTCRIVLSEESRDELKRVYENILEARQK